MNQKESDNLDRKYEAVAITTLLLLAGLVILLWLFL